MALTRRCPLHCDHCSTNSTLTSEEMPGEWLLRLAGTFTETDRPEFLFLSGGEPLLRPTLVCELADLAHAVGTRVGMITGGYFADGPTPRSIQQAIDRVDLLTVSIDVFHEREVSRRGVFDLLDRRLAAGGAANLQAVGTSSSDPYLEGLVTDVQHRFGGRLPVLVGHLGPSGRPVAVEHDEDRARSGAVPVLISRNPRDVDAADADVGVVIPAPEPCSFASWPVVGFDGTVVACCQQTVIDGPAPGHLRLGHASDTSWAQLRDAGAANRTLRAIRVYGPEYVAAKAGHTSTGYCDTCTSHGPTAGVAEVAVDLVSSPTFDALESVVVASHRRDPLRGSMPGFQHLVHAGGS